MDSQELIGLLWKAARRGSVGATGLLRQELNAEKAVEPPRLVIDELTERRRPS